MDILNCVATQNILGISYRTAFAIFFPSGLRIMARSCPQRPLLFTAIQQDPEFVGNIPYHRPETLVYTCNVMKYITKYNLFKN